MNSWTTSDLENIVKALGIVANGQKAYGKEINVRDLVSYFRFQLEGDYPAEQVLKALKIYINEYSDIPAPADIIKIIKPKIKTISYEQYKHSYEQWRLSGYPNAAYDYHGGIVQKYQEERRAESDEKEKFTKNMLEVVSPNIKTISGSD